MPTAHRRYAITETEDIADALRLAASVWPELVDKPGTLLRRLILAGRNALANDTDAGESARKECIEATSGAMSGVFGPNFLKELREADWPE